MSVVYKCKECGGEIEPQENGLGKCLYCGAVQTLPKDNDEKLSNLLNRANDYRMHSDFDRAIFEYERVLELNENEPEAHWGLFLSKYGVEYVKDSMTLTSKPTLHRISSVSVFDDVDYQATIKYASAITAEQYKKEAADIEAVMKELLLLSANQQPYDIFLSYKELDDTTRRRTEDSYLAHDLYNELTAQGYKVFFAPKSLGVGLYEPKIYAAIISSKVMIVLGTKPEYYNAVWVKNEWSRFAELIDHGERKILLPVFKNMEAKELPNKLAKYQAYNIDNMSFLPSLLQVVSQYTDQQSHVHFNKDVSAESAYLERGFLALGDGSFAQAESFFENVLNLNPHNSQAYFGKLMVEMKVTKQVQILTSSKYLKEYKNFEKAVRFADQQLKTTLLQYEQTVQDTIDEQKYKRLIQQLSVFESEDDLLKIIKGFQNMRSYKNADEYAETLATLLQNLNKIQEEIVQLKDENQKKQKYLHELKVKKMFDSGEFFAFKVLGIIAGVVFTIMATIEGWKDSNIFGLIGGLLVGGIIFVGGGMLAGWILDVTLGNLIMWLRHKFKTRGISEIIQKTQQQITDVENHIAEYSATYDSICKSIVDFGNDLTQLKTTLFSHLEDREIL